LIEVDQKSEKAALTGKKGRKRKRAWGNRHKKNQAQEQQNGVSIGGARKGKKCDVKSERAAITQTTENGAKERWKKKNGALRSPYEAY